jgi:hypothetical protein
MGTNTDDNVRGKKALYDLGILPERQDALGVGVREELLVMMSKLTQES